MKFRNNFCYETSPPKAKPYKKKKSKFEVRDETLQKKFPRSKLEVEGPTKKKEKSPKSKRRIYKKERNPSPKSRRNTYKKKRNPNSKVEAKNLQKEIPKSKVQAGRMS